MQPRAEGLTAGSDDKLSKPFAFSERVARINALARRPPVDTTETDLSVADLTLDLIKRTVVRARQSIELQLLLNLIDNALRHTPVGTHIRSNIKRHEGKVQIVVSDTGPGIPEQKRVRVFRHFYRLDTSRPTSGNGIGLSFVAAVVQAHDATINLDDNTPGLKVTITFS